MLHITHRIKFKFGRGLLVSLFLYQVFNLVGQTVGSQNRAAQKAFEQAREFIDAKRWVEADKSLLKAIEADSAWTAPRITLAALYFELADYEESKQYFESVLALDSLADPMIYYKLGEIAWKNQQYAEVTKQIRLFLRKNQARPAIQKKAEKYLRDAMYLNSQPAVYKTTIQRLPETINTEAMEYLPSIPAREDIMIFTRRVNGQEDFYISNYTDGQWQPSKPITELNTDQNEGAHCLSANGKMLIFTACDRQDGLGSCDLYYSVFNGTQWSKPANLGAKVNTRYWEGQPTLSSNGKTLYFSSDRPGGQGGRDLWSISREGSGWGQAINLSTINTESDDEVPFIHASDESLYFMSDGHPGWGGTDLFVSRKIELTWQTPINLGSPINTDKDEGALHVNLNGTKAYFARTVPVSGSGKMEIDIFEFELPLEIRPLPATYVNIRILEKNTDIPLQAILEIMNLRTNRIFSKTLSGKDGEVLVCLPMGEEFALNISKEKYAFHSEKIKVNQHTSFVDPFQTTLYLSPLIGDFSAAKEPIVLNNIFFASGSAQLLDRSQFELNKLFDLLKDNPMLKIEIRGHTDNIGSEEDNQQLSEMRAKSIYDYLVAKGISMNRLSYQGFGESMPLVDNFTEEGREINRRSEFLIVEQ